MKLSEISIGMLVREKKAGGEWMGGMFRRTGHVVGLAMNSTDAPEVLVVVRWALKSGGLWEEEPCGAFYLDPVVGDGEDD